MNLNLARFTHCMGKHLDRQANHYSLVRAHSHVCVCVGVSDNFFLSTFVFILPGFQFHFIETLPSTISSPVLIVAATNQDKNLRLDNEYPLAN